MVYVIREVGYDGPGSVIGASGGPFVDWVAVEWDFVIPQVVAAPDGTAATPLSPLFHQRWPRRSRSHVRVRARIFPGLAHHTP